MTITQERIARARVVTPASTFVKHDFVLGDGVALVRRDSQTVAELSDVTAEYAGPRIRVEGTTPGGERAVWLVDNLGCGCGTVPHVLPTPETDIPT